MSLVIRHQPVEMAAVSGRSNWQFSSRLNDCSKVLPRFGGYHKIGAIMRWEVSYDEEEEAI